MASLHSAAGAPAAFDHRVFAASPNPFLRPELPVQPLRPLDQNAPLAESVEVTVLWGTNVLAVAELSPPRRYAVGEVGGANGAGTSAAGNVDFAMAAEKLGSERREIVALRGGVPFAIFGVGETPRVLEQGRPVDASGAVVDCSDVALGARGIELRQGRVIIIEASGLSFRLGGGEKVERMPRAVLGNTDRTAWLTMGSAALLQGMLVASLAYFTPNLAWANDDELDRDRLQLMQQYLHASAERETPPPPQTAEGGGEKGAPAERARGPEGAAGSRTATQHARMAIAGQSAERVATRAELLKEATDWGTIGLLNVMNQNLSPSSPFGADLATGPDNVNAVGDIFSQNIGEGIGTGGLGLSGTGLGGGGKGDGIGMGNIGTCMGLNCYGRGGDGFGRSNALAQGGHVTRVPRVKMLTTEVSGRLPPDVIQRIVRQNFGRFRNCYESGLRTNPNLAGRVVARFVIGRDGAVSNVSAGGDLADSSVRSCVASAFYGLSFPAPDAGIVTVSYPIMLQPG
jgi:hypothetical protein